MDWIIQATRGNLHLYLDEQGEKFTTDINRAKRFRTEIDAQRFVEWEGAFGPHNKAFNFADSSWLRNRYPQYTFQVVNVSITCGVEENVVRHFVTNRRWNHIGGGVFVSSCGNHGLVSNVEV